MCGIFGLMPGTGSRFTQPLLRQAIARLFLLSENRGKEASGLAIRGRDDLTVHRVPFAASKLLTTERFARIMDQALPQGFRPGEASFKAIIGHSRLTTNGFQGIRTNNQPVRAEGLVGVHNGIIVNVDALWRNHPELTRRYDVDTEVLMALLGRRLARGDGLEQALDAVFPLVEGTASTAILFEDRDLMLLASNTGSLYTCRARDGGVVLFTSERHFLESLLAEADMAQAVGPCDISQVAPGTGLAVAFDTLEITPLRFNVPSRPAVAVAPAGPPLVNVNANPRSARIFDSIEAEDAARAKLRRCTRCVLPETMPYITFDEQGVCNYCHAYTPIAYKGPEALLREVQAFKGNRTDGDCIIAFSGGRDSCYSLHYAVRELGLRPIAYTYDWGMVNDLARRNQARLTGQLGIEQIIISADIKRKRRNIKLNVEAWLRQPDLGLIPLFMAGDKHFFHYANVLKKQTGIANFIWAENQLERTNFKVGFCGISSGNTKQRIYRMSSLNKLLMIQYYLKNFAKNPRYINQSLIDTFTSFLSYYFINHDYLWFFDYIPWEEKTIEETLIGQYDWETDPETRSTWRIGDGTAAFYNYIYYAVAGFTENDTFRSNQIRQGMMDRETALALVAEENRPRYQAIQAYLQLINVDFDLAMGAIDSIPRLYRQDV